MAITIQLCESCIFADAYGFPNDMDQDLSKLDAEPLSRMPERYLISPARAEDGEPAMFFSWDPCDGCGSKLGGMREDFLLEERERA